MKQIELIGDLPLKRPAIKVYSRIAHREIMRVLGKEEAARACSEALIDTDCLWSDNRHSSPETTWRYADWFRLLALGYKRCGHVFGVNISKGIATSAYPIMEEILSSCPNFKVLINFYQTHYTALEPLVTFKFRETETTYEVAITYPFGGKVREAFTMSAAAMMTQMMTSITGTRGPKEAIFGFRDDFNVTRDWSQYWNVPARNDENQTSSLRMIFDHKQVLLPNVGGDADRYSFAVHRFHQIVDQIHAEGIPEATIAEKATALMMTGRCQYTRPQIAQLLQTSEKKYLADLDAHGYTHKKLQDEVNAKLHYALSRAGYTEKEIMAGMGITDKRKLTRVLQLASS